MKITDNHKIKTSDLIKKMRKNFDVYVYDEDNIDKNFPPPKKTTTRYFKKNIEADEELKDMSADQLKDKGIEGITLRERLIMELNYFDETGNHLDIENFTLCSGSRSSVGGVPSVDWSADRRGVFVDWCSPSRSYPNIRSRAVVSNPSTSNFVLSDLESRLEKLEAWQKKIMNVISEIE